MNRISIAQPVIGREEKAAVVKVLSSGGLIQGKRVEEFEHLFADYIGTKYAVAVSSGTAALHLVLHALNLSQTDQVITTPFSFIASASAITLAGGKTTFADIDSKTYNIDPSEIERRITKKTKVILPVHLYGLPALMPEIMKIAKRNKLFVLEDACQAHGAMVKHKKVGSIGDASCFSFYPTKNMYAGEGGMITTNSKTLASKLRALRSHGSTKQYYHSLIGFNYRMTDIAAALGILQLRKLDANNSKRISNAALLSQKLKIHSERFDIPFIPKGYTHVFHQYTIRITDKKISRDRLQTFLSKRGIETRVYYPLSIPKQKVYKDAMNSKTFQNAEDASKTVLSLPIHPLVTKRDVLRIADDINSFMKKV